MANVSKINGFMPVKHLNGSNWNGQSNIYWVPDTDAIPLFVGDPVKLLAAGNPQGVKQVTKATSTGAIVGVVIGVINTKLDPISAQVTGGSIALDTPVFRPANTGQYVLVADAPDTIFEVEGAGAAAADATFTAAMIGQNADSVPGTGNLLTGNSTAVLNITTAGTGATLQFKILGSVVRPDNVATGDVHTKVLVTINNHQYAGGTGTVGV
jgi:hypothetical protein